MNNLKTLTDTLKKAPLPNNSLTAKKEWEKVVDNILATKPVVLTTNKTVGSDVVHLDPITIPKGGTINYIESFISEDITFTALASGSIPAIGVRMSFNEPIETKTNANTWLIPNIVVKAEAQVVDPNGTTLPTTSSEFNVFVQYASWANTLSPWILTNNNIMAGFPANGDFSGSMVQIPMLAPASANYNGADGGSNVLGRGQQFLYRKIGYQVPQRDYGGFYSGSSAQSEIQNDIFGLGDDVKNPLYRPIALNPLFGGNSLYWRDAYKGQPTNQEYVFSDLIYKEHANAAGASFNGRNFDEETEIYLSLYFFSFSRDQIQSASEAPGRLASEFQNGTIGECAIFTPLTIETPGEVTFSTTIINN